jgi:hypothetical protein
MAQVLILRREYAVRSAAPGQVGEVVAITYSTPAVPPRSVDLPLELYRPATADERAANPRYHFLPMNDEAAAAEREAIQSDMKAAIGPLPESFELP